MKLAGKVAIVTGAGQGIGEGIARVLAREGAKVVVADINEVNARAVAESLTAAGFQAAPVRVDVSNEASVQQMVEFTISKFGVPDILVNNAGVGVYTSILDTSLEDWNRCLSVDLTGVFLCSKYVVPHMQAHGGGSIVNIASVHSYQNVPATAPYAAAKGGVVALTREMALDFGKDKIRVNAVCPGWIYTPLTQGIFAASGDAEKMKREVAERQVLGRLGTPEDVGLAVLYLASDDSSFVTGSSLFVDGGLTAQLETW